jgi:antitoxin component YwqK of YwqJK toxin-antitoxin module
MVKRRCRQWLFCGVLILCFFAVEAQPGLVWPQGQAGKDYNVADSKGKRQGPWIRAHAANPKALYYRGQFKDGVPVGEWEWYYESGELMTKMNHIKGDQITDNLTYYEKGGKMSEGRFEKKKIEGKEKRCREGLWKFYDESGQLKAEEQYTDSLLNGEARYYYSNGKLASMMRYVNGTKEGAFIEFYDNGKKQREGTYLRGTYGGALATWYDTGMKETTGQYTKGLPDGTWYYYKSNGAIEVIVLYKMGKEQKRQYMEGTHMEYYDDGIPKCEYSWESGKKNGPFTEWYDLGHFEMVPDTKEDADLGIRMKEKLVGAVISRTGDYLDDQLEGEIKYFGTKGELIKTENYVGGKLQP